MISEAVLQSDINSLITRFGDPGVFLAMFLESSIIPIPSEVVVAGAGAIGIPLKAIVVFGALGSTLGAMVGYAIGRYGAMPVILRFGKFVFIKPHHIYKAEAFAKKYGIASVLIGRVAPVIPFKVFSIAAGITCMPFIPFVLCTMIGVVPRIYLLAIFGAALVKFTKPVLIILFFGLLLFLAFKLTRFFYQKQVLNNKGRIKE